MKVLILGGTAEARQLAAALSQSRSIEFVSSLAGRVRDPALPVGPKRIGGFGGIEGLVRYLRTEGVDAVVDATHPFAEVMTQHAERACVRLGLPLRVLRRPGWTGDWHRVASIADVPDRITALVPDGGCVFLTTGRGDLAVFAGDAKHRYLVRMVDPPEEALPAKSELVLDRGPYTVAGERELMRTHQVALLVTKDSGGELTSAKLTAAGQLGVPVLMVSRPPLPAGVASMDTVDAVLAWLAELAGAASSGG
ncbi:MAG TPA: cobalt-precorrin-6A reductase [Pseudonocardiaceae bacterium]